MMHKLKKVLVDKVKLMPESSMGVTHASLLLKDGSIISSASIFNCNLVKDLPDGVHVTDIIDIM